MVNLKEYKEWLLNHGWAENAFTMWKYLHGDLSNYAIGKMFNLPECNLKRWQSAGELPCGIDALFRVMLKVDAMGLDTASLF